MARQPAQPGLRRGQPDHAQSQAPPIQAAAQDQRLLRVGVLAAHPELIGDVLHDAVVGGGRGRQHRNAFGELGEQCP